MAEGITVRGIDHIMLNVQDQEKSLAFYTELLGLEPVRVEEWRAGTARFPSVRLNEQTIIDLVPPRGAPEKVNHFCFLVDPVDFDDVQASGNLEVEGEASTRYGGQGFGTSLFVIDPDGNRVELRHYS